MQDAVQINQATRGSGMRLVAGDLAYQRHLLVNVIFSGLPGGGDRSWVLIDTGLFFSARRILRGAERRFGPGARPAAIVLTHGHFDHVGALRRLAARWEVPVYAHPLELPHITGQARYLPPNPLAGGGLMALLSVLYPRGPIDVGSYARPLPADGTVPGMPGWRWIHTPGHTAGHVALFRDDDGVLVAGDAFVTTKQESLLAVLTQRREVHGPPAYFTPDWRSARQSVETLAALEPARVISGHGRAMEGVRLREELHRLAHDFGRRAVPRHGRHAPPARARARELRTA